MIRQLRSSSGMIAIAALFGSGSAVYGQAYRPAPPVTSDQVASWMTELSNWGRWGPEDQLGTLNLVTAARRATAFGLVRDGVAISLARPLSTDTTADNGSPLLHTVRRFEAFEPDVGAANDRLSISYHGYAHTHVDALNHIFYRGQAYNGYSSESVIDPDAPRLGIDQMSEGIATRAVLVDLPELFGVPYLEPGHAILAEDLEAWERRVGIRVGAGDALLIRTGRWARRAEMGPWPPNEFAGLHASTASWLKERDVAVLGGDAASDVQPSGVQDMSLPLHVLAIVGLGMPLLDNLDLEQLSRVSRERGQYEFLMVLLPLRVVGGIGSPASPVAVF